MAQIYEISSVMDSNYSTKDNPYEGLQVQIARAKEKIPAIFLIEGDSNVIITSDVEQIEAHVWDGIHIFTIHTRNSIYHLEEAY